MPRQPVINQDVRGHIKKCNVHEEAAQAALLEEANQVGGQSLSICGWNLLHCAFVQDERAIHGFEVHVSCHSSVQQSMDKLAVGHDELWH